MRFNSARGPVFANAHKTIIDSCEHIPQLPKNHNEERNDTMNFINIFKKEATHTYTENGAQALNTTGDACLDLFSTAGALRNADEIRINTLFAEAYAENPLFATKIAFYARDIREGLGERCVFRTFLRYMADNHPEALRQNLDLVGVYGRYDDLYALIGTRLEDEMWFAMKKQFEEDLENLEKGNAISLLAKWIKTADASASSTRRLGILTAQKLGYSVYDFKRIVRRMRKQINVVECLMSAGRWDEIKYSEVPSRAMMIYRKAFVRHDAQRFNTFINRAAAGEEKINSAALYPYDIVHKICMGESSDVLEAQWRQLPNYIGQDINAIVMADVSGSMTACGGIPLSTSIGLAIYFAERNTGAYHNLFMTFSADPQIVELKGETLQQKILQVQKSNWGMSTNLRAAFDKILQIACKSHASQDEMPKSIIVISDMEIDSCDAHKGEWTFYDKMAKRYRAYGYEIPNIVFWNVNSRHNIFHADKNRRGVQLCSGQSATVFKQLISCVGSTPTEMMQHVINSERYECIKVG